MKFRTALVVAIFVVVFAGCAPNRTGPERVKASAISGDMGLLVLSTGAAHKCMSTSSALLIQPEGAAPGKQMESLVQIDGAFNKSDFPDHQGLLNVVPLKAGRHQIYPTIQNPYVKAVHVNKAIFNIVPGQITYLGEYYMDVACVWNPLAQFRDQEVRDMTMLAEKNPELAVLPRHTQIGDFSTCFIGCQEE